MKNKEYKHTPKLFDDDLECYYRDDGWGVLLGVAFIILLAFLIYKTI